MSRFEQRAARRGGPAVFGALLSAALCACGGAGNDADRHALYSALQREEARGAAAEHSALEGGCDAAPPSCDEACEASHAARDVAERIGERDASVRAERVERVCVWCRSQPCEPPASSEAP